MVKTTKLSDGVHKHLGMLGRKNETYDDIVARLIVHYAHCPEARKEQRPWEK